MHFYRECSSVLHLVIQYLYRLCILMPFSNFIERRITASPKQNVSCQFTLPSLGNIRVTKQRRLEKIKTLKKKKKILALTLKTQQQNPLKLPRLTWMCRLSYLFHGVGQRGVSIILLLSEFNHPLYHSVRLDHILLQNISEYKS